MITADALVAFLRDRLDELEQAARKAAEERDRDIARGAFIPGREPRVPDMAFSWTDDIAGGAAVVMGAEFVLADVESKRKVIEMYEGAVAALSKVDGDLDAEAILRATIATCEATLRLLALPFVDHEAYDERWRP